MRMCYTAPCDAAGGSGYAGAAPPGVPRISGARTAAAVCRMAARMSASHSPPLPAVPRPVRQNIIACRLYRPGCVGYVSKSGGMSNELNNIMAAHTDGVCEGVAIGGDRYPGSRFIDHLLRYQANPAVKLMVLLGGACGPLHRCRPRARPRRSLTGPPPSTSYQTHNAPRIRTHYAEVGGTDEYDVAAALRDGRLTKPLVAWCIGTCATLFPFEVRSRSCNRAAGTTLYPATPVA